MMISNATILRIDTGRVTGAGSVVWTQGTALAMPAVLDVPTSRHHYELGAVIKDASAVVYVLDRVLDEDSREALLSKTLMRRIQVQATGRDAQVWDVVATDDRVHKGMGNVEVFVKGVTP